MFLKTKGHYLPRKLVQKSHTTQVQNILHFQQKTTLYWGVLKENVLSYTEKSPAHWCAFCHTLVIAQFHHQFQVPHFESSGPATAQVAAQRLIRSQE